MAESADHGVPISRPDWMLPARKRIRQWGHWPQSEPAIRTTQQHVARSEFQTRLPARIQHWRAASTDTQLLLEFYVAAWRGISAGLRPKLCRAGLRLDSVSDLQSSG